jgi:nicotinate-nucleotide pyrophosphorylase (carboxylating)
MESGNLDTLLKMALKEDLGTFGDVTSEAIFGEQQGSARLICREGGVLAGSDIIRQVYKAVDSSCAAQLHVDDGSTLSAGQNIADITGPVVSILKGERTALNFLSYLSGIATETYRFVRTAEELGHTAILDTRKTLPGYRELAKYAVAVGKGKNHRMGLYDMVLIKDNHIDAAGSITNAVNRVREKWDSRFTIEVECRDMTEVEEALAVGVDIIMLDNMSEKEVQTAIRAGKGDVKFEASGDMDLEKVRRYSALGLDYISVGRLTHSVRAVNFSMLMNN